MYRQGIELTILGFAASIFLNFLINKQISYFNVNNKFSSISNHEMFLAYTNILQIFFYLYVHDRVQTSWYLFHYSYLLRTRKINHCVHYTSHPVRLIFIISHKWYITNDSLHFYFRFFKDSPKNIEQIPSVADSTLMKNCAKWIYNSCTNFFYSRWFKTWVLANRLFISLGLTRCKHTVCE